MYFPPVEVNAPMSSFGLATVIESKAADFPKGTIVNCLTNWREHAVIDTTLGAPYVSKVEGLAGISETHTLGALGLTGVTAYHVSRTSTPPRTMSSLSPEPPEPPAAWSSKSPRN
jgi:NADPH-dependent curcumin reductase CurA